jgi:DNA-binding NarL/FixJ family response regulator
MAVNEGVDARELTVVLADDQVGTRIGIRAALEPHGLRVVAEAETAGETLAAALRHAPDVCLLSATLPGGAIDVTRLIKARAPQTRVVMLSAAAHNEELFGALRAGADGYLLMTTSPDRLSHAIRGVVNGEAALPRSLTAQLIREFRDRGHRRRVLISADRESIELTAREFEVLERLRRPERTAEIAHRLSISEVTVRRHISSILTKLGAPDRKTALAMIEQSESGADASMTPDLQPQPGPRSLNL